MRFTIGFRLRSGFRSMTDEVLHLQFPWQRFPVEVPSPSSLTPREYKYLQWCLDRDRPSSTKSRRFLALVGFMTYRQAVWVDKNWKRTKKWHYQTGYKAGST